MNEAQILLMCLGFFAAFWLGVFAMASIEGEMEGLGVVVNIISALLNLGFAAVGLTCLIILIKNNL